MTAAVRHVLLDADGVVQLSVNLGGEIDALTAHLGDDTIDFLTRTFPADGPVLRGHAEVLPLLAEALIARGSDADPARLYADLWLAIEVSAESLAVARWLQESGVGVHLGTNQDLSRAAYMKAELGYDDVFDTCFYSCDVGWAKPSTAFFDHVVTTLRAAAGEVLFVDDSPANVEGARAAGLTAERWEIGDGLPALRNLLAGHGLDVPE